MIKVRGLGNLKDMKVHWSFFSLTGFFLPENGRHRRFRRQNSVMV